MFVLFVVSWLYPMCGLVVPFVVNWLYILLWTDCTLCCELFLFSVEVTYWVAGMVFMHVKISMYVMISVQGG